MIHRGDVWDAELPIAGSHPAVVVTREAAIPVLSAVAVVLVTSTVRGHRAEVALGSDEGLDHDCVANCDQVFTLPKSRLTRQRGRLGLEATARLDSALRLALGLD